MKYQAPQGCTGISVGGEQFNVDDKCQIDVPDAGDYHGMLAPHGFKRVFEPPYAVVFEPVKAPGKKEKAKTAANESPAEPAAAAEPSEDKGEAETTDAAKTE